MDIKDLRTQQEALERRIKYDEDMFNDLNNYKNIITDLLADSEYIGLSILFPFRDFSTIKLPKKYYNWQIRCCVELYNLAGKADIASYSENGLSWTKFKSGLSLDLLNELTPRVGTPKSADINYEEE